MGLKQPLTKLYYSIGEIAEMFHVNTSLIRFWEKEFPQLKPSKNSSRVRKYTKKDVETFYKIYHLIKEEGFTLEGAKKHFSEIRQSPVLISKNEVMLKLEGLKRALIRLKESI